MLWSFFSIKIFPVFLYFFFFEEDARVGESGDEMVSEVELKSAVRKAGLGLYHSKILSLKRGVNNNYSFTNKENLFALNNIC